MNNHFFLNYSVKALADLKIKGLFCKREMLNNSRNEIDFSEIMYISLCFIPFWIHSCNSSYQWQAFPWKVVFYSCKMSFHLYFGNTNIHMIQPLNSEKWLSPSATTEKTLKAKNIKSEENTKAISLNHPYGFWILMVKKNKIKNK